MHPISRRSFLAMSAAVVVTACSDSAPDDAETSAPGSDTAANAGTAPTTAPVTAPATAAATTAPPMEFTSDPFTLGVASGDPADGTVVLWTRLAPDPLAGGGMPDEEVEVTWEAASDERFTEIVASGTAIAEPRHGHSLHVVADLPPGWHWYRFSIGDQVSPIGRTRTAPRPTDAVDEVRFVSASCQNYQDGFYTAHRDIAAQQPDFVTFLGDYIYEGRAAEVGVGEVVRSHATDEVTDLVGYRNRYALYKSDPDLRSAHAACPWFVTWDDHEVENNYAALTPQDDADAASFAERRLAAYQAWWEHQPVALPAPTSGDYRIHRAATWGTLLTLAVLDGRQYRSDQACGDPGLSLDPPCDETFDPARTMLGVDQEAWLFDTLEQSGTVWRAIAQQTVFGDVTLGGAVLNYDQWDGYPVERNRIVDRLDPNRNTVVLTGDIHFAGTGTIRQGGRGTGTPVGVEFVATSISSGGRVDPAVSDVVKSIPDILDVELEHRGYILHTVRSDNWTAEYRMVETVKEPDAPVYVHATYRVAAGENLVGFA